MSRLPSLGPRGEGWVILQGLLLLCLAISGMLGPAWSGAVRTVTSVIGVGAIFAGLYLAVRGIRDLGSSLTPLPHPRPDGTLVVTGVYGLVRHPIYGGLIVAGLGWGMLTASPAALVAAGVLWAFFELKSRREEIWLESHYAAYAAYKVGTRRLIPWLD
jgi:protein-S-isoprenylcysteine O-methyltransferase Ste14